MKRAEVLRRKARACMVWGVVTWMRLISQNGLRIVNSIKNLILSIFPNINELDNKCCN